jgi:hypothetical protein
MPIFVQWKWNEGRKSFLIVFHFYDDFSRTNLRIRKYNPTRIEGYDYSPIRISNVGDLSSDISIIPEKAWMTWAPDIPEMGYLLEVLKYAFMINGLSEREKRELRSKLEAREDSIVSGREAYTVPKNIGNEIGKDKRVVIIDESLTKPQELPSICVELCPEYIDYLRKILQIYFRS